MQDGFILVNESPMVLLGAVHLRSGKMIVGRATKSDICILDPTVSREHAELTIYPSGISVKDLGSANGTFLDDEPIESATLKAGQHLRFGNVSFMFAKANGKSSWSRLFIDSTRKVKQNGSARLAAIFKSLTPAQRVVLNLVLDGHTQKEVAELQNLSSHTVHNHLRGIYEAFGVHSRAELLAQVLRRPLLGGDEVNGNGSPHE